MMCFTMQPQQVRTAAIAAMLYQDFIHKVHKFPGYFVRLRVAVPELGGAIEKHLPFFFVFFEIGLDPIHQFFQRVGFLFKDHFLDCRQ